MCTSVRATLTRIPANPHRHLTQYPRVSLLPLARHMLKHCNGSTGPGLTPAASFCAGPPCVGAQDYFKNGTQVRVEIDR